ncbi:MAG: glycosyl transferase [Bacteroidales bacterium]|nr:glycosyl transferase [Bacteroidales bacterium]
MTIIFILILVVVSSYIGTFLVRRFAIKKSIIDIPNQRSSHTKPTPRGGGLVIVVIWYVIIIWFFITEKLTNELFYAFLSGSLLAIVSLLDDIFSLSAKIRLIIQVFSAGMAVFFISTIHTVDLGFYIINSSFLVIPFVFIGLIWFVNLFNFLDGIDGYAASQAIFISLAFFILTGDFLLLYLIASIIGFLIWNWQPAKIFMGDIGSTVLGFTLGVLTIYYSQKYKISIFTLLIPSALFWFDATYTLFRRWRNKEKLSEAHKKHAYQRIVQSGFSHQKTVISAILVNFFLLSLTFISYKCPKISMLIFIITLVCLYFLNKLIDKRKSF